VRLFDKSEIRSILQRDPRWCVYALGDLTPRMFEKCLWFTPDLTMVLHDYGTSILFAHGTGSIREALEHVRWPVHLQVQQDALDEVAKHAEITDVQHMQRMSWNGGDTEIADGVKRLQEPDVAALKRLYADGDESGESPDFFYDSMVPSGVFFGIYEGAELIAAAGTHLFAPDEHAAAIGNVYTRRDRRGRGLGRAVTSAVLHRLRHLKTVGLNVREDNAPAIRVYESLGFVKHCAFKEALGRPRALSG
jgi:ribosomal protein S18 acetylase RimI-like enzyme